MAINGPDCGHF